MPFTLAHPGAVVFIKNKHFNLSALILGSMAPDFIYFMLFSPSSNLGHTILGSIIVNIPLCFLLNYIYYKYIKDPFILNSPNFISKYYWSFLYTRNNVTNIKEAVVFMYSSIIGMITHVFLDSFTHKTGYFVLKLNFLRQTIDLLGHKIYVYKIAQHGGTVLGFIIILIFLYKMKGRKLSLDVSIKNKFIYHIIAILIGIVVMLSSYIGFSGSFGIGRIVVSFINALFLGYLVSSIFYRNNYNISKYKICIQNKKNI